MSNTPTVPDFGNIGATSATPSVPASASKKPTDIFGLGALYGQPIYLGQQSEYHPTDHSGPAPYMETGQAAFGKTQDVLADVSKMWATDPAGYEALQAQLAQAGYYGITGHYVPGRFDAATQSALKSLVDGYERGPIAGKQPITLTEFLQQNAAATSAAAAAAVAAPPVTHVSLTDPASIRQAATAAFEAAVGKAPTGKQLDNFVSTFQAKQASSQTSEQTAIQGKSNSATVSPDLGAQATAYAQQQDPQAYQNYKATGYQNALLNLFLPSESQRANITPQPTA